MKKHNIVLGPLISEKSMTEASKGRFTFKVGLSANKKMIRKVIEEKFKVHVINISTVIIKGRSVRAGVKRLEVSQSPFKKATVTLKAGEKIGLFDVGTKK